MDHHSDALEKLEDAKAVMDELLPDPDDAYGKIGAEMRDAMLSSRRR